MEWDQGEGRIWKWGYQGFAIGCVMFEMPMRRIAEWNCQLGTCMSTEGRLELEL